MPDDKPQHETNPDHRMHQTAKRWLVGVLLTVALLFIYYILSDHYVPYTSDAYIQGYVVGMAPDVPGRVVKVAIENDQAVKAGDLLFELESTPYDFHVKQHRAALVLAQNNVEQLQDTLTAATAKVKLAEAHLDYAQTVNTEKQKMLQAGAATPQEAKLAQDQFEEAKASVVSAKADEALAQTAVDAMMDNQHAQVVEAEAKLAAAEDALAKTKVYAPFDGTITNLQLQPGDYLSAGDAAMTLVDTRRWWIVANYRENALVNIEPGQDAEVSFTLRPGEVYDAKVTHLDYGIFKGQGLADGNLADIKPPTQWINPPQRFAVRLEVDPSQLDDVRWRIGATTSVTIYTGDYNPLNITGWVWQRLMAWLDFVY